MNLNINDNSGNYLYLDNEDINIFAIVMDDTEKIDTSAPVLNGIKLNKSKIKVGEILKITVDAKDDLSGIGNVYLNYSVGNYIYYGRYIDKDKNGEFKLSIDITEDMLYKTI